jgi:hypothetical protein
MKEEHAHQEQADFRSRFNKCVKGNWLLLILLLLLVIFVVYKLCVLDIVWEVSKSGSGVWRKTSIPSNAAKVIQTGSQAELIRQSYFLTVPIIICFISFIIYCKKTHRFEISRAGFVTGAVLSFLLQPIHELLHGIAFPGGSKVYIGFIVDSFSGYAISSGSIDFLECIVYHLLPAFILGVVPLLLFISFKQKKGMMCWAVFGFSMIGLVQTAPDWFGLYPILTQVPYDALIIMSGWDTYWFIP